MPPLRAELAAYESIDEYAPIHRLFSAHALHTVSDAADAPTMPSILLDDDERWVSISRARRAHTHCTTGTLYDGPVSSGHENEERVRKWSRRPALAAHKMSKGHRGSDISARMRAERRVAKPFSIYSPSRQKALAELMPTVRDRAFAMPASRRSTPTSPHHRTSYGFIPRISEFIFSHYYRQRASSLDDIALHLAPSGAHTLPLRPPP